MSRQNTSPQTFYKWRRRFVAEGLAGLEPRSRRPHTQPGRAGGDVEALVVATRRRCSPRASITGRRHPVTPPPH
ncbi:helix-turn-helix domain-containing protein [Gordonia sp. KTR9]|uniref:helix-turn-helix domain-containing protein n=1 Tax=Gordonia sp. KTR9 TaxID=337191 RepID=UPI0009FE6F67